MRKLPKTAILSLSLILLLGVGAAVFRYLSFRNAAHAELRPPCAEGPDGSEELRVAGTFSNEFFGPSDPPSWCSGLDSRFGGRSEGPGSGTIGPFTFSSRWCMESGTLRSQDGSFGTEAGEILLSEETRTVGEPGFLEALVRTRLGPPLEFEGEFTIRGGTGAYTGATGSARLMARQLGGGRTAMAACGYILTPTAE